MVTGGGTSGNQTLTFLLERFAAAGIRPRPQLGQNFLVDLNLLGVLVRGAQLGPEDVVLEVGTGTGSLTARIAPQVAAVVSVEVDRAMAALASQEVGHLPNVHLMQCDVLKGKNRLNPGVLQAVDRHLGAGSARRFKLVANLPYCIATPLVTNLLALERPPETMTITIQKEVADRITAAPGSKDYGSLSIWVQSQCRVKVLRWLPPTAFWPRPKVYSAMLRITLDDRLRSRIRDRVFFHGFIRAMFLHRRKFLRSELLAAFKTQLDKPRVDAILQRMGLGADTRAEQLRVEQFLALGEAVQAELHHG